MNNEKEYLNGCNEIIEKQKSINTLKKNKSYHKKKLGINLLKATFKFFIDFEAIPSIILVGSFLTPPFNFEITLGLSLILELMCLVFLSWLYLFDVYPFFDFNSRKIKSSFKEIINTKKAIKRKTKSIKLLNQRIDSLAIEEDSKVKSIIREEIIKIDDSNYSNLNNIKKSNKDELNDLKYLKDLYLNMKNNYTEEKGLMKVKQKRRI